MDKRRSLIALDAVNFFVAAVETGLGPFLSTYFSAVRHWNPAQIGIVVGAQSVASVIAQTPAGWLVDWSHHKRWLIAISALIMSLGAVLVVLLPNLALSVGNQILIGAATALPGPTIAAISLGIVGKKALSRRIGRNESFLHTGNLVTALFAGFMGRVAGQQWIFFICGFTGVVCAVSALGIRGREIDDQAARAAAQEKAGGQLATPIRELWHNRALVSFAISVVLFHVANAAMLPLAGQELSRRTGQASSAYMSVCIAVAQVVMIPVALASGRLADKLGRKPILVLAFAVLSLRGILFALGSQSLYIVAVESLDGVGTAIAGVLTVLVVADLASGTGRFNLLQGAVQACVGCGAFAGNSLGGLTAKAFGFPAAFAALATVAGAGLVFFVICVPETSETKPPGRGRVKSSE